MSVRVTHDRSLDSRRAVILDCRHAGHLYGSLYGRDQNKAAEGALALEQLEIRLGFMLVLEANRILDLIVLCLDPWITLIAVSMELSEGS